MDELSCPNTAKAVETTHHKEEAVSGMSIDLLGYQERQPRFAARGGSDLVGYLSH